jgi:probable sporulation protein (polysaccharide deacetylase family)
MMRRRFFIFIFILCALFLLMHSSPITTYTEVLSRQVAMADRSKDPLYQEILKKAREIEEAPVEPRVDRIWKLIPGYSGLRLDVEATYKNADRKNGKYQPILTEIPPRKSLWEFTPQPIYRGNPKKKMVALMINVAWGNEYLVQILETLEEKQVKATFFLDGSWLSKNPELAKQIAQAGHEIGSHAYSHPSMSRLSKERIIEEIEKTNQKIEEVLQIKTPLFAPPSGDFDQRVVNLAWERKMLTILWTLDTVDWRKPPAEEMVNRILSNVENGYLILMHPTEPTAKGLIAMIEGIEQKGLSIGTVSEVISPDRVAVEKIGDF